MMPSVEAVIAYIAVAVLVVVHVILRLIRMSKQPGDVTRYESEIRKMLSTKRYHDTTTAATAESSNAHHSRKRGRRSKSPAAATSFGRRRFRGPSTVVVTGGCGRLGSEVLRELVESSHSGHLRVVSVDRISPPARERFVPNVEYVHMDVLACSESDLLKVFSKCDVLINCAAKVSMNPDTVRYKDAFPYLLARCTWAAVKNGCFVLIHASDAGVVHDGSSDLNGIPHDAPYAPEANLPEIFKAQVLAEKFVLKLSELDKIRTCVCRFPQFYGFADNATLDLMIEHQLGAFPNRRDARVEFIYVKNAAHAMVCAMKALMDDNHYSRATGRALVCTETETGETQSIYAFIRHAQHTLKVVPRPIVAVPVWMVYVLAYLFEWVVWYLQNNLPHPNFMLWSFNRRSLGYSIHDNTFLGQRETYRAIGYQPKFSRESAFEDIRLVSTEFKSIAKLWRFTSDPLKDIDWSTPHRRFSDDAFAVQFFHAFVGPGMSRDEMLLFLACGLTGVVMVWTQRNPDWNLFQLSFAAWTGFFNFGGLVTTTTASNKRWFHLGGVMAKFFWVAMISEVVSQLVLLSLIFDFENGSGWVYSLIVFSTFLIPFVMLTWIVPLRVQRAWGVYLTVLVCFFFYAFKDMPFVKGLEWFPYLLSLKINVCHAVRHEPYV